MRPPLSTVTVTTTRRTTSQTLICEICGGRMVEKHCKIQCLNCGYTRDCSDP